MDQERLNAYKDMEKQVVNRYGIKLDEVMELRNLDSNLDALSYAYALGFKRGVNCEKNRIKSKKKKQH